MLCSEIRPRMKDNTVCKTKLENCGPVMNTHLLFKAFGCMLLPLLTNNFKLCDQQLGYRNQSSYKYTITIMEGIIIQYNK